MHSSNSQQTAAQQLRELHNYFMVAQKQADEATTKSTTTGEDQRISSHLRKLAHEAESFHSSASTVIEGDRSTVWGGSIYGDPLSHEKHRDISEWIPPPIEEEPNEGRYAAPDYCAALTDPQRIHRQVGPPAKITH
jgi:hypothetical protein